MRRFSRHFPVDDDFFEPLDLAAERLAELREEAQLALESALAECNKLQTARGNVHVPTWPLWKVQAQFEGLSAYARVHDSAPTVSSSRICGTIQGNYLDIARFFTSETRQQYFNIQKRLFPDTVDASVVYNVPESAGREGVSEGVKWAVYSPSWSRHPMDNCFFESTGTGVDSDGHPYFYRVVVPAGVAEVPDLSAIKRTQRTQCWSVMIVSPCAHDASSSEVFGTMLTDVKDSRVGRGFYKRVLTGLRNACAIASKPYTPSFKLQNGKWVLPDLQRVCDVCSYDFSMLRSKHQCFLCSKAVCRKCLVFCGKSTQTWRGRRARQSTPQMKACMACVQELCRGTSQSAPRMVEAVTPTKMTPQQGEEQDATDESVEDEARFSAMSPLQSFHSISPGRTVLVDESSHDGEETIRSFKDPDSEVREVNREETKGPERDFFDSGKSKVLTIDTADMTRVSPFRERTGLKVKPTSSPLLFRSIRSSLREQSKLLRQLQQATGSSNANRNK